MYFVEKIYKKWEIEENYKLKGKRGAKENKKIGSKCKINAKWGKRPKGSSMCQCCLIVVAYWRGGWKKAIVRPKYKPLSFFYFMEFWACLLSQDWGAGGPGQPQMSTMFWATSPQRCWVPSGRRQRPAPALPVPYGSPGPCSWSGHQVSIIAYSV
jgi:hypothetical protein